MTYKEAMIYQFESARAFLQSEFDDKVRKNSRYSLRSFASYLKVHPAELSQVFKGSRNLSLTSAQKVIQSYGFNNDEAKYFLWLIQRDKGKNFGLELNFVNGKEKSYFSEQKFSEISKWYHFAILSLIETASFQWSSQYVAKKLGLTLSEAGLAMRDLQKCGLVKVEKKSAKSAKSVVHVAGGIPSDAIRNYHRQMLNKALDALDSVPTELREYQSVGLALDEADLKKLKAELDEFTDRLMAKYHKKSAQNVYQIQICTFPVTKGVSK